MGTARVARPRGQCNQQLAMLAMPPDISFQEFMAELEEAADDVFGIG
jgi:hypothetical protein